MINTDGKATVANWTLKHGGQDVPTTPPSDEGRREATIPGGVEVIEPCGTRASGDTVQGANRSISSLIEERERTAAADNAAIHEAQEKREELRKERAKFMHAATTMDDDDFAEYLNDMVSGNTEEQA